MSKLSGPVLAGTDTLSLVALDELWADELAGHLDAWFSDGDIVVFDPGEELQEIRRAVSAKPLILDRPLAHDPDGIVFARLREQSATPLSAAAYLR